MAEKKFPYKLESLTWDNDHIRNIENKYCYCGKDINDDQPVIRCEKCRQLFHGDCISCMAKPLLYGDTFGTFHCSVCNQGPETFQRKGLSWIAIVHLVIYNLIKKAQVEDSKKEEKDRREHYYFRWKEDVCAFIDEHWDYLVPDKQRSLTWNNTIASVLSTHNNLFLSGFEKLHQSAWWTLHTVEPPSNEKRSKSATRLKPNLKRPLKRSKAESETPKPKKLKKVKKEEPDPDLLDLSSLSELSSADELSSDEDLQPVKKKKAEPKVLKKPTTQKQDHVKNASLSPKFLSPRITPVETLSNQLLKVESMPKTQPSASISQPSVSKSQPSVSKSQPSVSKPTPSISKPLLSTSKLSPLVTKSPSSEKIPSVSKLPPSEKLPAAPKPKHSKPQSASKAQPTTSHFQTLPEDTLPSLPLYNLPLVEDESPVLDIPVIKEEKPFEMSKPSNILTSIFSQHLTQQDEWSLLQRLEHSSKKISYAACRYKRKLAVRRLKRNLGIKLFDMDTQIIQLLRTPKHALEPISKETTILPASNQQEDQTLDDQQHLLDKITFTPYASSFASRLFGSIRQRETITREEPWLSSWNGRKLRPFIRRDYQSKPKRMLLMGQIKTCKGRPCKKGEEVNGVISGESIDYVYFQKEHLTQVNQLLSRSFWEGIDVSESLLFPEFSIVALYKRHVIGCAFMTPEAYITYFAVDEGWGNASIGQFMLYHLFQTAISKDITLHVSANNNAMILYQKFGFKPEEFIVNFYDKYYPADSVYSKNAFFLRLRR